MQVYITDIDSEISKSALDIFLCDSKHEAETDFVFKDGTQSQLTILDANHMFNDTITDWDLC